jgi:hypothetical protein
LVGVRADSGFARLRTQHFASALEAAFGAGQVLVVDYRDNLRELVGNVAPRALVTASNYGPTKAACRALRGNTTTPFWLDVAGDPFAEAQSLASVSDGASEIAEDARMVWGEALARADAFSVVCEPGRWALLGALGALGRLPLWPTGSEPVWVVPNAMSFPDRPGLPAGSGAHVALIGGFNTWLDDETLLAGLLLAMELGPVWVTVVGGASAGHYEAGFDRFQRGALASRHRDRFRFLGWVPHDALADVLAPCQIAVVMDRPGPEAELGSRTRLLYALHRGLRVVATPCSPLARELAVMGLLRSVPPAHEVGAGAAAQAVADAILGSEAAPSLEQRASAEDRFSVARTCAALSRWVQQPARGAPLPEWSALAALSAEVERLRAETEAMRASPSFRLLNRIHRKARR